MTIFHDNGDTYFDITVSPVKIHVEKISSSFQIFSPQVQDRLIVFLVPIELFQYNVGSDRS